MKSWQHTLIGIVTGLILAAAMLLIALPPRGTPVDLLPAPTLAPLSIYVSGAVSDPGVYQLPQDSRVEAAIEAAGGLSGEASQQELNLAARLKDGERIHVPSEEEAVQAATPGSQASSGRGPILVVTDGLININTASLEELTSLPGIGDTRANDIIAYRESHGGFQSIDEIEEVPGIGPATFERLRDLISTE